jgi:hypothetical protein
MSSIGYIFKIEVGNEPKIFTSKLISRQTSSSKESLRSIKVHEGKCEDEICTSYFTTKALRATFTTNVVVLGVRIMP